MSLLSVASSQTFPSTTVEVNTDSGYGRECWVNTGSNHGCEHWNTLTHIQTLVWILVIYKPFCV